MGLIEKGKCPSHDTLQRVYSMLDSNEYRDAIIGKIKEFMVKMIESDPRNNKRKRPPISAGGRIRGEPFSEDPDAADRLGRSCGQ